jgi:hypothetical protein
MENQPQRIYSAESDPVSIPQGAIVDFLSIYKEAIELPAILQPKLALGIQ